MLQINWFNLISIDNIVKSLYRRNQIMGCLFCRDISRIYSKRFWDNFRIIPQIYKCEALEEPFKFINQLWILNNFFITVYRNLFNRGKFIILFADIIFNRNDFLTWNNTRGHHKLTSSNWLDLCLVVCYKYIFFPFVNINIANNLENIVNHIIKFGRSLTNFVIVNHMNTPNELNYFGVPF